MMKALTIFISLILLLGCSGTQKKCDSQRVKSLNQMVDGSNYFQLLNTYTKQKKGISEKYQLYFESILANAFNQPQKSNQLIKDFFEYSNENDTIAKQLLQIKLVNHIHLSEYIEAMRVNETLKEAYAFFLDSIEVEDLKNTHKIWLALKDIPKQKIFKNGDATLPIIKDKAGLSTIATKFGNITENFVFDTGANFSVIQKSVAEELGMKIIPVNFNVEAVTGLEVKSDLAVAKKLELGTITLKNVIFLVFDDGELSFPSINYEINGIIGFPVIRALEEIQIKRNGQLFVPKVATHYDLKNLAVDEYMPIVKVDFNGDVLYFNFDTGAQQTALYSNFFEKYRQDIESKYKKVTLKAGGAGGHTQLEGYVINNFTMKIGDSKATLDSLQLFTNKIGNLDRLDGNLGQNFIRQFGTMIISFKYASILFQ